MLEKKNIYCTFTFYFYSCTFTLLRVVLTFEGLHWLVESFPTFNQSVVLRVFSQTIGCIFVHLYSKDQMQKNVPFFQKIFCDRLIWFCSCWYIAMERQDIIGSNGSRVLHHLVPLWSGRIQFSYSTLSHPHGRYAHPIRMV